MVESDNVLLCKVLIGSALNSQKDSQEKNGSECVNTALLLLEMLMYVEV